MFVITEKAPSPGSTFKTLLSHYAKQATTHITASKIQETTDQSKFHVYLLCLFRIVVQCLKFKSTSRHFQPGEGPSRDLHHD